MEKINGFISFRSHRYSLHKKRISVSDHMKRFVWKKGKNYISIGNADRKSVITIAVVREEPKIPPLHEGVSSMQFMGHWKWGRSGRDYKGHFSGKIIPIFPSQPGNMRKFLLINQLKIFEAHQWGGKGVSFILRNEETMTWGPYPSKACGHIPVKHVVTVSF